MSGGPIDLIPFVSNRIDADRYVHVGNRLGTSEVAASAVSAVADWCDQLSRVRGGGIRGFIGAIFLRATAALLRDRARIARPR